jgi:hypothetical protein
MKGAGAGRPRKPEGTTRHRNPPTRGTIVIASDARVAVIPDPVFPLTGVRLDIWTAMWDQPIATLWNLVDLAPLTRLVVLQTTIEAFSSKDLLSEMRQLEDRFLLNPLARVQQRVVIEDGGEGQSDGSVSWFEDAKRRLDSTG